MQMHISYPISQIANRIAWSKSPISFPDAATKSQSRSRKREAEERDQNAHANAVIFLVLRGCHAEKCSLQLQAGCRFDVRRDFEVSFFDESCVCEVLCSEFALASRWKLVARLVEDHGFPGGDQFR